MIEIRLCGGTVVGTGDGTTWTGDLGGVKPRQVLEILALTPGVPVSKERLADLLWDGEPPRSWVSTLEGYVCVLRRALRHGTGRRSVVSTVMRGYVLDPEEATIDLAQFRALRVSSAAASPAGALELLDRALGLVTGDLFPHEPYAAWAVSERSQLRAEMVEAATLAAGHALALGDPGRAVRLARVAVDNDPLAENARRLLMSALWRDGRRGEALRAYADLRDVLASELGAAPDRESHGLYLSLLREDGDGAGTASRDEIRLLLELLRVAVGEVCGRRPPQDDRALIAAAARVAGAA